MLRQCTCSAFFATEDGLCEHLDEYRLRERHLQAELKRCEAHLRVNNDDDGDLLCDYDHRDITETNNSTGIITENGGTRGHFCPSCARLEPFKKKQGLRRHYQQHVTCEEVCVCCFKVFRLVRDFLRHAEQHDDAGERKLVYIKSTCDDLRRLSDKQLDLAMRKCLSDVAGKKRTWISAFDPNTSATYEGFGRSNIPATDQNPLHSHNLTYPLHHVSIESIAPPIPLSSQSPTAQPSLAHISESTIASSYLESSAQVHPHEMQVQGQGWDVIEDFDAPLLQIMNSIPIWMTRWDTGNPRKPNPDAAVGAYQGS